MAIDLMLLNKDKKNRSMSGFYIVTSISFS